MPNLQHMTKRDQEPRARFSQNSGNGVGPQILVRPGEMSDPAAPETTLAHGAGKGRKTKLAAFGLSPAMVKAGDPRYSASLHQANKYRKMRMKELAQLHGHVSAGVGALLASAALALAASRFLYEATAEEPDNQTLKDASKLADSARQHELAAYELASREGTLKRRVSMATDGMPWMLKENGDELAKPGRKTNEERFARETDVPVPPMVQSWEEPDDDAR